MGANPRVEIDGKRYIPFEESNMAAASLSIIQEEHAQAVEVLRGIWEEFGWPGWSDELHLVDLLRMLEQNLRRL